MKLVAIGFLGDYTVYVDLSREEAIRRYDAEYPDYTVAKHGLHVKEVEVRDGRFQAYDIE